MKVKTTVELSQHEVAAILSGWVRTNKPELFKSGAVDVNFAWDEDALPLERMAALIIITHPEETV